MKKLLTGKSGVIALLALFFLVGLSGLALALLTMFNSQTQIVGADIQDTSAFYLAEAGRAKARRAITTGGTPIPAPPGKLSETVSPFGAGNGTYVFTAEYTDPPVNSTILITSDGYFPNNTNFLAHRQVRESIVQSGGGSSGTNISIGSTATASSSNGSNVPSRAVDGNTGTKWKANINGSSWLRLDFGTTKTFTRAIQVGRALVTATSFQYSANGSSWTTISGVVESPTGTFNFPNTSARYLRMTLTGNRPEVQELRVYNASSLPHGTFVASY